MNLTVRNHGHLRMPFLLSGTGRLWVGSKEAQRLLEGIDLKKGFLGLIEASMLWGSSKRKSPLHERA